MHSGQLWGRNLQKEFILTFSGAGWNFAPGLPDDVKGRAGNKAPPKRNNVYQNALYAAQFKGILAIGTKCLDINGDYPWVRDIGLYGLAEIFKRKFRTNISGKKFRDTHSHL